MFLALKTSPAIHEQKKLLERAKTGDLLKAKIQQRPDRQELERRHILDTHEGHIDPSLADKYRMLEKAILVDQLNSKISHRPGPLELIEKNILHADEPIERIVKEGLVPFKLSTEDIASTSSFLSFEDDSQSSEGDLCLSPMQQQQHTQQHHPQQQHQQQIIHQNPPNKQLVKIEQNDEHHDKMEKQMQTDVLENAAASAGIINLNLAMPKNESIPTNATTTPQVPNFHIPPIYKIKSTNVSYQNSSSDIPPPPPPPIKTEIITYHISHLQTKGFALTSSSNNVFLPILQEQSPVSVCSNISSMSPDSSIASQSPVTVSTSKPNISALLQSNNQKYGAPGKDKNRKKTKNKPVSKMRAIKFHEYKGPPNSQKSSSSSASLLSASSSLASATARKSGETNYELILQQQCLLEYLEGIYKHPPILPVTMKPNSNKESVVTSQNISTVGEMNQNVIDLAKVNNNNVQKMNIPEKPLIPTSVVVAIAPKQPQQTTFNQQSIQSPESCVSPSIIVHQKLKSNHSGVIDVTKLGKMKVSELKSHLKKLNLPVSGPKPLLIERLKPFLPLNPCENNLSSLTNIIKNNNDVNNISNISIISNDMSENSIHEIQDNYNSSRQSVSSSESDHDFMEILQSQQASSETQQQQHVAMVTSSTISTKEDDIVREQQRKIEELQRKLMESQHELEQMKQIQNIDSCKSLDLNEQIVDDEMNDDPVQIFSPKPLQATFLQSAKVIYDPLFHLSGQMPTVFVVEKQQPSSSDCKSQTKSAMVSLSPPLTESAPKKILKQNTSPTLLQQQNLQQKTFMTIAKQQSSPNLNGMEEAPPAYDETRHNNNTNNNNIKLNDTKKDLPLMSQDITDVLEILIKNGEWVDGSNGRDHNEFTHPLMINPNSIFDSPVASSDTVVNTLNDEDVIAAQDFVKQLQEQHPDNYNVLSPMQEEPTSTTSEDTIDKLLGQAQNDLLIVNDINSKHFANHDSKKLPLTSLQDHHHLHHQLPDFNDLDYMTEFPMEIEEDSTILSVGSDYIKCNPSNELILAKNNNLINGNDFLNCCNNQGRIRNIKIKSENCDNIISGYNGNNSSNSKVYDIPKSYLLKSETMLNSNFMDHQSKMNLANELTGNCDYLLDSYRNNNNVGFLTNSYDTNKPMMKVDNCSTNLNSCGFMNDNNHNDSTPMDFEPFDLQSHMNDPLFRATSPMIPLNFDHSLLSDNNLFNDDFRMNSDAMNCEVDNLLCNI